jgi:3-oxoacyl-[acyl-carrier-protein] synthase-1
MKKKQWICITPSGVEVSGSTLATSARGAALLTELYRTYVNDYPKYFKMDAPTKLGFLASELLLRAEGDRHEHSSDRAVVVFGRNGSIVSDHRFQATTDGPKGYFPSPSVFVYTLPNMVAGEIALRIHYHGETAYYALDHYDPALILSVVATTLADNCTGSIISGWVDYIDPKHYEAAMELLIL